MKLARPDLMADYMAAADFTQARLARYAGCSRQFVHMLLSGDRTTCTPAIAARIEEALRVLPGTLFIDPKSPTGRSGINRLARAAG